MGGLFKVGGAASKHRDSQDMDQESPAADNDDFPGLDDAFGGINDDYGSGLVPSGDKKGLLEIKQHNQDDFLNKEISRNPTHSTPPPNSHPMHHNNQAHEEKTTDASKFPAITESRIGKSNLEKQVRGGGAGSGLSGDDNIYGSPLRQGSGPILNSKTSANPSKENGNNQVSVTGLVGFGS